MLQIRYLVEVVSTNHFAKCHENQLVTRNANKAPKIPYSTMVSKVKK